MNSHEDKNRGILIKTFTKESNTKNSPNPRKLVNEINKTKKKEGNSK